MVKASPPQAKRISWFVKVRLLVRFQQQTQKTTEASGVNGFAIK